MIRMYLLVKDTMKFVEECHYNSKAAKYGEKDTSTLCHFMRARLTLLICSVDNNNIYFKTLWFTELWFTEPFKKTVPAKPKTNYVT